MAFLDLASGKHAEAPFVEYYKVQEFELLPQERTRAEPGFLSVDGEQWQLGDTRVKLLPRKLKLMGGPAASRLAKRARDAFRLSQAQWEQPAHAMA